jgi:DNA primase
MQDAKEEVRSRLNIEDVIGQYVQLKRAGRNFKGLSPFSSEKTPSFIVSPDKQIWHDFSSNKGGDLFTFVMEVEGMDFRAALEHLARLAGVDLAVYDNKGDQAVARLKKRILEANDLAANYYQQSLIQNQHAKDYVVKKRGLDRKIIQDFRLGYAPTSGDALVNFLNKKGFTGQELAKAGLTNRFGGDLFRGRMAVPLMDSTGRVIGFTGRIIVDDNNSPKYLNTPQTLLYDKSRHVFGLSQAKEAIRLGDHAVIVEGNLDVISSHQADVKQVVATAGTALTEYHLRALLRLTSHISLAFDNDKAGLAATERAITIAQHVGVELSIITLPGDAKDPDELIRQDPKLWKSAIDNAEPAVDWVLKQYMAREDINTAAGKRRFTDAALNIVKELADSVERGHYIELIAKSSDSSVEALNDKLTGKYTDEPKKYKETHTKTFEASANIVDSSYHQDNLLAVALINGETHELFRQVDPSIFIGEERRAVVDYLINKGGKSLTDIPEQLKKYDIYVKILLLKAETRYADWNDQARYFEAAELLRQVAIEHKRKEKEKLTQELREAEDSGNDVKAEEIRNVLNKLIKEIQSGQR